MLSTVDVKCAMQESATIHAGCARMSLGREFPFYSAIEKFGRPLRAARLETRYRGSNLDGLPPALVVTIGTPRGDRSCHIRRCERSGVAVL
jgi:hypothetical protein